MANYDADEHQRTGYDHTSPRPQADLQNLMKAPMVPYFHMNLTPVRFKKLRKLLGK